MSDKTGSRRKAEGGKMEAKDSKEDAETKKYSFVSLNLNDVSEELRWK